MPYKSGSVKFIISVSSFVLRRRELGSKVLVSASHIEREVRGLGTFSR
jgi:hypothetical protein